MAGDTVITIVGNLVEDPNLRFTSSGQAVANFRIAATPRFFDKQAIEWKDGEALFLTCNVWRQAAENCAESLLMRGWQLDHVAVLHRCLTDMSMTLLWSRRRSCVQVQLDPR